MQWGAVCEPAGEHFVTPTFGKTMPEAIERAVREYVERATPRENAVIGWAVAESQRDA